VVQSDTHNIWTPRIGDVLQELLVLAPQPVQSPQVLDNTTYEGVATQIKWNKVMAGKVRAPTLLLAGWDGVLW
jgi:hypothetical protein